MLTVKELIKFLEGYPQDLLVAAEMYSEQYLVTHNDFSVKDLCEPRPDGWVQNYRKDKPARTYLVIRGN